MASKTIGLCFSGGGHRASIFSLGALLYLVDADRHRDIKAISSVSGGSLTSGFLAVQEKPLHQMNRAEFDVCAASWAHQIAGSPGWWRTAMTVHVLLFVAWTMLVCLSWGWLPRLAHLVTFKPSWWETQVVYVFAVWLWARTVGSRPGGTFWGWWGTWFYLGTLGPAVFFLVFVWWSPLPWKGLLLIAIRLLIAILAACVFALRALVADRAFRATVTKGRKLCAIPPEPRQFFCSTEMQTGRHAYFSRDFIYSDGAGLGQPADLPLSTAIQLSANFPVAFPYRIIRLKKHDFQLGEFRDEVRPLSTLVLSDGGVLDNTGIRWFLDASDRKARLEWFLASLGSRKITSPFGFESPPEEIRQRTEQRLAAMGEKPDLLIVVNSSVSGSRSHAWLRSIPVLGELAGLLRVEAVTYESRGSEQSRLLLRRFLEGSLPGAMVSIEDQSKWFYTFLDPDFQLLDVQRYGLSDLPAPLFEHYKQRAHAVWALDMFGPNATPEILALDTRRRELRTRLDQLRAQQALVPEAGKAALQQEIDKSRAEMTDIFNRLESAGMRKTSNEVFSVLHETESSSHVSTTFCPLGIRATTDLLHHGYLNCMYICQILLEGFPYFEDPPSVGEMQQLAHGCSRQRYPNRRDSTGAAS